MLLHMYIFHKIRVSCTGVVQYCIALSVPSYCMIANIINRIVLGGSVSLFLVLSDR